MYITSGDELFRALEVRTDNQQEIAERADAYIKTRFGIDTVKETTPSIPKAVTHGKPIAFLARQIASVCAEDVSFEIGARHLGFAPVVAPFVRDAFTKQNHDKVRRVVVPWSSWSRDGHFVLERERVSPKKLDELEGLPLMSIVCNNGQTLPEYHQRLRRNAMLNGMTYDVSGVHLQALTKATKKPSFVYRRNGDREMKHHLLPDEPLAPGDRPPSHWYYPYYLSWFLDGSMVLFETYENPIGDVSRAGDLFAATMNEIHQATGYFPLVVKIPPLSQEMLYCNRHLQWRHEALPRLTEQTQGLQTDDTVRFFETIAKAVIAFR